MRRFAQKKRTLMKREKEDEKMMEL